MGVLVLLGTASAEAGPFSPPERITGTERKFRMSRCANNQMAFDSSGFLQVTYWSGGLSTLPSSPSYIYHQSWNWAGGWGPRTEVDESFSGQTRLGGRHPSLAVDARDTVWITWHDHRHGSSGGNWIDNTEIYADAKPVGGSFIPGDIRITQTLSGGLGDNGYTPKMVAHPDGRLAIAWYDFGLDANVSDLFLKLSDSLGVFSTAEPLASLHITDKNNRGGAGDYTVPDMALTPDGVHHLCWVKGSGSGADLYYGSTVGGGALVQETLLAVGASDFFDPGHLTTTPQGDVYIVYGDDSRNGIGAEDVVLLRRGAGQAGFDSPIVVAEGPGRQYAADVEVDSTGLVHLVWVHETGDNRIRYGVFDPNAGMMIEQTDLTGHSALWARPSLVIDPQDQVYVMWEEEVGLNQGAVWFATNATGPAVVEPTSGNLHWDLYD